jgi:hypothetical protein
MCVVGETGITIVVTANSHSRDRQTPDSADPGNAQTAIFGLLPCFSLGLGPRSGLRLANIAADNRRDVGFIGNFQCGAAWYARNSRCFAVLAIRHRTLDCGLGAECRCYSRCISPRRCCSSRLLIPGPELTLCAQTSSEPFTPKPRITIEPPPRYALWARALGLPSCARGCSARFSTARETHLNQRESRWVHFCRI